MKKSLLIVSALSLVTLLGSCASNSAGSLPSDPTPSSSAVPASSSVASTPSSVPTSEASGSGEVITLPTLHVALYTKQITDTDAAEAFKTAFAAYVASKGYAITTITYDYVGSGKVSTLNSELQAFEAANYPCDVVLGAKAVAAADAPWFNETFEVYMNGDANFEFDFGGNTTRRLWQRKETTNDQAVLLMINYFRNLAGLPDEGGEPSSSSSESSATSSESSVTSSESSATSSESSVTSSESSSVTPTVYPVLHVGLYEYQISDSDAVATFFSGFNTYLAANHIQITSITQTLIGSGKVSTLDSEIPPFETEHYEFDVILGAKGVSSTDAPWFNATFAVVKKDGNNYEFPFGGKTDRRIWTRKTNAHAEATQVLVDYCFTLTA